MSLMSSLAAINGLMRLRGDELPEPGYVSICRAGDWISVQVDSLADLRAWARHFGAEVISFGREHRVEIAWGAATVHLYVHEVQVPEQRVALAHAEAGSLR
jgi:hypothetical protein